MRKRPNTTHGSTVKVSLTCGPLFITKNYDEQGLCEIFLTIGKSGSCAKALTEGIGRLISLALRAGVPQADITKQLRGVHCLNPSVSGGLEISSCSDAIAAVMDARESPGKRQAAEVARKP